MRKSIFTRLAALFMPKQRVSASAAAATPSAVCTKRKPEDAWLFEADTSLKEHCRDHRLEMQMATLGMRDLRHKLGRLAGIEAGDIQSMQMHSDTPILDEHDLFDGPGIPVVTTQDTTIGGADDLLFDDSDAGLDLAQIAA